MASKIPDDVLIEDLCRIADELGKSPTIHEYDDLGKYSSDTIADRFNGWNAIKEQIGLKTYNPASVNASLSDEHISKALSDIKYVADMIGHSPSKQDYDDHGQYSVRAIIDKFGSWNAIKQHLDLEVFEPIADSTERVSNVKLLNDIKRVSKKVGHSPSTDEYNELGNHSSTTIAKRFGSWNIAKQLIGLEVHPQNVQDQVLLDDIKRVSRLVNGNPSQTDYETYGRYTARTIIRRFDGWVAAKSRLGFRSLNRRQSVDAQSRMPKTVKGEYDLYE